MVLLNFPFCLVQKTCPILSTNQMQNLKQSRIGHSLFPRFKQFDSFHSELLLVNDNVNPFLTNV